MGQTTKSIAAVVGLAVGLTVLAMGPAAEQQGRAMVNDEDQSKFVIDGARHATDQTIRQIVQARTVPATPAQCWQRWTTGEGVGTFLSEDNAIDLRVGGVFEVLFAMQLPEGQRGSEDCKILSFVPERMLSFEWNAPPMFPEVREERSRVVVFFEPVDGGTRVELVHLGFGQGEQWDQVYEYFSKAWMRVMDRFAGISEA